jgi:hypothetical protein
VELFGAGRDLVAVGRAAYATTGKQAAKARRRGATPGGEPAPGDG